MLKSVNNFMNGKSYKINPVTTLKMITASSIFGEPSYYIDSDLNSKYCEHPLIRGNTIMPQQYQNMTTNKIMEDAIDKALDCDFLATLKWAMELRTVYNMRLNPQIIMVRAAIHPKRKEFTSKYPKCFNDCNQIVMSRADEPMVQMAYYLHVNSGKNNIPSILKRSWCNKLGSLNRYNVAKYKNHEIGMINAVRLCHASSPIISELMRTGTIPIDDNKKTWENCALKANRGRKSSIPSIWVTWRCSAIFAASLPR